MTKTQAKEIPTYKEEVLKLGNALQKERLQVKALSEELENPMNHHRWNQLKGTDPETFELLNKINTLQKRLIKKTEEVVERDAQVIETASSTMSLRAWSRDSPVPKSPSNYPSTSRT